MTNLPIPAGQVEVTQADCEAISRIATEICDNGSCRCRTGAQEQAIASRIWQWCRHRLLASTTGEERAASLDHADTLETIQNADDGWQAKGYSSALAEVRDMANVGRALMEALPEGYSYMDCPSEIVSDLQSEIADLTTPSTPPVPEVAAIPVGMKLVPVEPTEAMIAAAKRIVGDDGYVIGPWKAMLAAAPPTPDTRSADVPVEDDTAASWLYEACFPRAGGWSRCSPENKDTWRRRAADVVRLSQPPQTADTDAMREAWEAGRDAAVKDIADMARLSAHLVHPVFVPAIEGVVSTIKPPAALSPTHTVSDMGVDANEAHRLACVLRIAQAYSDEHGEDMIRAANMLDRLVYVPSLTADKPEDTQRLREALEPFARQRPHKNECGSAGILVPATVADVRLARSLLNKGNDDGK